MRIYLTLLEELQEVRSFQHDFTNLLAGEEEASIQAAERLRDSEFAANTGSYFDEKLGK